MHRSGLLRDSRFGGADAHARAAWYERDQTFDDKIANYFYKTRIKRESSSTSSEEIRRRRCCRRALASRISSPTQTAFS